LNLPIAIIIGLLNGLSILLKWKFTESKDIWKQSRFSVAAALLLTIVIFLFSGVADIMLVVLTFSSAFALFVNGEIAYKIFKGKKSYLGAYVAHIGIALFLIGVVATGGYTQSEHVDLVKGESTNVLGHDLTFRDYTPIDNGKKYAFNVEIKKGNSTRVASPVMFVSDFNNSLMREPDIVVGFTRDFYVAPVSYSEGDGHDHSGQSISLSKGETYNYSEAKITFVEFNFPQEAMSAMMSGGDFQIGAKLSVEYNGVTKQV
jgi:cytochrome c-type biogenesis protein CcmF